MDSLPQHQPRTPPFASQPGGPFFSGGEHAVVQVTHRGRVDEYTHLPRHGTHAPTEGPLLHPFGVSGTPLGHHGWLYTPRLAVHYGCQSSGTSFSTTAGAPLVYHHGRLYTLGEAVHPLLVELHPPLGGKIHLLAGF